MDKAGIANIEKENLGLQIQLLKAQTEMSRSSLSTSIQEWVNDLWTRKTTYLFEMKIVLLTGYSFWDPLRNVLHKFTWIVLSVLINSGKFMDHCWISCQVMADMKKVYDDLIIINLYVLCTSQTIIKRAKKWWDLQLSNNFTTAIMPLGFYTRWVNLLAFNFFLSFFSSLLLNVLLKMREE